MSRSTASSMLYVDKNKGFHAEWKIENFSLFRLAGRKPLRSPVFNTNTGGVIRWWRLCVYHSDLNVEFKLVIYRGENIYDDLLEISLLSNGNGMLSNVQLPRSSEEPESVFLMSGSTASIMSYMDENKRFNAEWKIKNFSLFRLFGKKPLRSPVFKTDSDGIMTWWRLLVYCSDGMNVDFKLIIYEGITVNYFNFKISLLSNGTDEELPLSRMDLVNNVFTFSIEMTEIFGFKRNSLLPQDTLTVCFRISELTVIPKMHRFHTILQTINFSWLIINFNFINQTYRTVHQQDSLQIMMLLIKGYKKGTHTVRIETQPGIAGFPYLVNCKFSIEDGRGDCLSEDSINPTTGWLFFLNLEGINYEDITLEIKCLVATDMGQQPESTKFPTPVSDASITSGDSVACSMTSSTLKEDLLLLYQEGIDSDVTIKTKDSSFPVHKTILSARSKVFRAMFQTDNSSEHLSGIVNIQDIDRETVERMLIFMYGDTLEDMQWEDALDLYYAADKYAIHSLKLRCADILKAGVTVSNVCQLLVLADNHSDEELIRIVVEFIHDHDEVISLAEWVELETSYPKLTMKIMRELYLMQRCVKPKRTIA